MPKPKARSRISSIPIEKLITHPDNPNRMSKRNLAKLVRNIERTGRYEPLIVRPYPHESGFFQVINGRHRRLALLELGYETVDAVVWDVDDTEADILLATLNHLAGRNVLDKRLALLRRLSGRIQVRELAKFLPQSASQIERLSDLKTPRGPAETDSSSIANPMVFFVSDEQQQIIEKALSLARQGTGEKTKAARNAAALTCVAKGFNAKS